LVERVLFDHERLAGIYGYAGRCIDDLRRIDIDINMIVVENEETRSLAREMGDEENGNSHASKSIRTSFKAKRSA
jgi:arabinogalactan endo-1,4-beta-galactosidase